MKFLFTLVITISTATYCIGQSVQFSKTQFPDSPNIASYSSVAADVDGDGDYDKVFAGSLDYRWNSLFYLRNDGQGNYSVHEIESPNTSSSDGFAVRDLDNDGDLDIGIVADGRIKVFKNVNGAFTVSFEGKPHAYIPQYSFEDFNHDGLLDILYSHETANGTGTSEYTILYQNSISDFIESDFHFVPVRNLDLPSYTLGDFDNDGYVDVIFAALFNKPARAFRNINGNTFSQVPTDLPSFQVSYLPSMVHPFDFNQDGKLDLFNEGQIYFGKGDFNFTPGPTDMYYPLCSGDFDNNGSPDFIVSDTSMLVNNGTSSYTLTNFPDGLGRTIDDFTNDGNLDLLRVEVDQHEGAVFFLENETAVTNLPPSVPTGISVTNTGGEIFLNWNNSTDDRTPVENITYNLEVKNQNAKVMINAETNGAGTFRKVIGPGNVGIMTEYKFNQLPAGHYFARVQALDASYKLSSFSPAIEFDVFAGVSNLAVQRLKLNKIRLHWSESASNETAIVVQRRTANSDFETITELPPNTTEFVDDNLLFNQAYFYRVYARINSVSTSGDEVRYSTEVFTSGVPPNLPIGRTTNIVADFNDDGAMDIVRSGSFLEGNQFVDRTDIYERTGNGFTQHIVAHTNFQVTYRLTPLDLDGDNVLDLFQHGYLTGVADFGSSVFHGNGNFGFESKDNMVASSSHDIRASWDYDADNDLDFNVLEVENNDTVKYRRLENHGHGSFSVVQENNAFCMPDLCKWTFYQAADFDHDGDEDLVSVKGEVWIDGLSFQGYGFTTNILEAKFDVVDFDNDGWSDVFILNGDVYGKSRLYRNKGNTSGKVEFELVGEIKGSIRSQWTDFNHDGALDVLINPGTVYFNNGHGSFTEKPIVSLIESFGYATVFDIDSDGDEDICVSWFGEEGNIVVYNNTIISDNDPQNAAPTAPAQLSMELKGNDIELSWNSSTDDTTPAEAISYDVIMYMDGGDIVTKASINAATGNRRKLESGRSQITKFTLKKHLEAFEWRVQAVDNGFKGSPLSAAVLVVPPPHLNDTTIRPCGLPVEITAKGENLEWFSDEALTQKINSGNIFHPVTSQVVYVTQSVRGVQGFVRKATITIFDKTSKPVVPAETVEYCPASEATVLLTAAGENVVWYTDAQLTTSVNQGINFLAPTSDGKSYYVTQTIEDCESDPQIITLIQDADCAITAVEEDIALQSITISPNPSTGDFIIMILDSEVHVKNVTVLNMTGQKVLDISEPEIEEGMLPIHTTNWQRGVFVVLIRSNKYEVVRRLVML